MVDEEARAEDFEALEVMVVLHQDLHNSAARHKIEADHEKGASDLVAADLVEIVEVPVAAVPVDVVAVDTVASIWIHLWGSTTTECHFAAFCSSTNHGSVSTCKT